MWNSNGSRSSWGFSGCILMWVQEDSAWTTRTCFCVREGCYSSGSPLVSLTCTAKNHKLSLVWFNKPQRHTPAISELFLLKNPTACLSTVMYTHLRVKNMFFCWKIVFFVDTSANFMKEAIQGVGLMVPCDVSGLPLLEEQVLCQRTPGIITEMSRLVKQVIN